MFEFAIPDWRGTLRVAALVSGVLGVSAAVLPVDSQAVPLFARQTGQNCVSCHAGGQFPELTPYGRKFKLTGYTMGERGKLPLSVMAVASMAKVSQTTPGSGDVPGDFPQDGILHFTTASLFAGGKITDNLGLFGQWTYNAYDHQGDDTHWHGHSASDQFDLRYADRFIDANRDLIVGASLNNSPGVTEVWNTFNSAFTSVPGYVPVGNPSGGAGGPFTDVPVAPIIQGLGQLVAGINVYAFWNNTVYAEVGTYQTGNRIFSFMTQGTNDAGMAPKLKGQFNPYWRLALNHDWGANSAMIGLYGLMAETYASSPDASGPTIRYRDVGIDGQYQYILDPHMFSAHFSYTKENQHYADELWNPGNANYTGNFANASNTLDHMRLKATYVYQAKYGASLGYATVKGSADDILYPGDLTGASPFEFGNNTPNTRVWIPEVFWTPVQYVRIGAQYYKFTQFNGSSGNYDGNGRNASNNNTLFFYVWAAY
jgi:hypothetical protein